MKITIDNYKNNDFAIDSHFKNEKKFPLLHPNIVIKLPIEGGYKKKNIASCGFGTLVNRIQILHITMDEEMIKKEFLKQSNPISRTFKKIWRNTFGTTPKSLISGLDRMLKDKNQPYEAKIESGLSLENIINILKNGQPIMVMYTRLQTDLFGMLKQKYKHIEKIFKGKEHYFCFRYPHYSLLVGLDGIRQSVNLLDPNSGKIREIPFKLRREQFELQSHHSGPIFSFAKKIGMMKPKTGIYLTKKQ